VIACLLKGRRNSSLTLLRVNVAFFFWCFLTVGLLGGTTHPFSLSTKKWVLLNLILKGLIFYGFFFGGLTNGCSVSSFFIFWVLESWMVGWDYPPSLLFIIHKIVDYEKYAGTVRTVPFGTMPFIKNAFAFSMKSICALFCRMHWQNKVLPYWVF